MPSKGKISEHDPTVFGCCKVVRGCKVLSVMRYFPKFFRCDPNIFVKQVAPYQEKILSKIIFCQRKLSPQSDSIRSKLSPERSCNGPEFSSL